MRGGATSSHVELPFTQPLRGHPLPVNGEREGPPLQFPALAILRPPIAFSSQPISISGTDDSSRSV